MTVSSAAERDEDELRTEGCGDVAAKDAAACAKQRLNELRTEGCRDVAAKDAAAYAKGPQRCCV